MPTLFVENVRIGKDSHRRRFVVLLFFLLVQREVRRDLQITRACGGDLRKRRSRNITPRVLGARTIDGDEDDDLRF